MEFEFVVNQYKDIHVKCDMEQAACANWCNAEIDGDKIKLRELLETLQALKNNRWQACQLIGREYSIDVYDGEVKIYSNSLKSQLNDSIVESLKEEGIELYEQEGYCEVGLTDLINLLKAYEEFIS